VQITESGPSKYADPRYIGALGRKNGLIGVLTVEQPAPEAPDGIRIATPTISDVSAVARRDLPGIEAAGKGRSLEETTNAAFGEVVERYCLRFPPLEALEWANYEELCDRAPVVDYEYIDIYDREALAERFEPFDHTTELPWVQGRNLLTGDPVYIPAERVWFPSGDIRHEYHMPISSHGVAAGPTLEYALINALYETVESDSVLSVWCQQETPPTIEPASMADEWPEVHEYVADDLDTGHHSFRAFDCQTPVDLPVAGSVLYSRDEGMFPRFAHSVNSHIDPREAVREAITEAATRYTYLQQQLVENDLSTLSVDEIDNFESNRLYYALSENFDEVSFYTESEPAPVEAVYPDSYEGISFESKTAEYRAVLERFSDAGVTPIAVELTTRDVRDRGVRVVRVLVPELIPVSTAPILPTNHPRLEDRVRTNKTHCF
jgi:ribosomal protein S12 methylthiotransferase accessory factor